MQYDNTATKPVFVIKAGVYPATVIKAEEKVSKAGNPMMVVEVEIFTPDGKSKFIKDFITTGGEYPQDWRLKHLAKAVGLPVTGTINAIDLQDKSMHCKIGIKPAKGEYGESNEVKDYLEEGVVKDDAADIAPAAATAPRRPALVAQGASGGADEPPFAICRHLGE